MRCFFAIDIPDDIKIKIARLERMIMQSGINCKYPIPENLHITLMFLGEIQKEELLKLIENIEKDIIKEKFVISINKIEMFRQDVTPKIVFLDIEKGRNSLNQINQVIYKNCSAYLEQNNIKNNFIPHLTIGRIKEINENKTLELEKIIRSLSFDFEFMAGEIAVYESTLGKNGAEYRKMKSIYL